LIIGNKNISIFNELKLLPLIAAQLPTILLYCTTVLFTRTLYVYLNSNKNIELNSKFFGFIRFEFGEGLGD